MASTLQDESLVRDVTNERPTTFVPGVGEVPSGPRSWLADLLPESVQPGASTSSSNPIRIKQEDEEQDSSMFVAAAAEAQDGTNSSRIKHENSEERARPAELDRDYQNIFSSLLASQARSTRSDTSGSRRQDTREGRISRSEATADSSERDRSRGLQRSDSSRHILFRDRSGSSTFDPNSGRGPQDPRSGSGASGERRRSRSPFSEQPPSSRRSSSRSSPPSQDTEEQQDTRCRCPIGYYCTIRSANCLDCRPLVREYGSWAARRDQEAFERHREMTSSGAKTVTDTDLAKITDYLQSFVTAATQAGRDVAVSHMRAWIMEMEDVTITAGNQQTIVSQQIVPDLTNFLASTSEAVRRAKNLPAYIEEELTVLERKWGRGDFDGDVQRGLIRVEVFDVNGLLRNIRYQDNPSWPFHVSALYFGAGDLVNGQIWESRVELQRDGVHAPPIAGISGTVKEGARSVVLGAFDEKNNLGYADIDMGEVIEYVGTALKDEDGLGPTNEKDPHMSIPGAWDRNAPIQGTAASRVMFKSLETKEPVRVIRSFRMCDIVTNKPTKGYRYDGLYRVVGATALKEARKIWSFRMVRLPDQLPAQGPLRGFGEGQPRRRDASGRRIGHFYRTR